MNNWPEGLGRFILEETDSTNSEAARLITRGASCPFWVMAHRQTAGRGRRGRAWLSKGGNFFGTLVLTPGGGPADWALRSFVMAVALREALVELTGQENRFALKWPNDVLLDGGKLVGVLLESTPTHLIIGVGVNLADAPSSADVEPGAFAPSALHSQTGILVAPEDFLTALAGAFDRWEAIFTRDGFDPVRREWLRFAAMRGQKITARLPNQDLTGIFEDLDPTGALILRDGGRRHLISAGDVFFGPGEGR